MSHFYTFPKCPRCGALMTLSHAMPRVIGRPEWRGFVCVPCHEVVSTPVERENVTPSWGGG